MAISKTFNVEAFQEWLLERPQVIQDLAALYPPNLLYVLSPSNQIVTLASYYEDGTVGVDIHPEYNPQSRLETGIHVFGVDPINLAECKLPKDYVDTDEAWDDRELTNTAKLPTVTPTIRSVH